MSSGAWPVAVPRSRWWMLAGTIGLLALAASFNGLWNDFAYDDLYVVRTNELVHDFARSWRLFVLPYWPIRYGGDGYRPLTLFAFSAQWAIAPGSAMIFHAVTIALYGATSVAAFWLATLLLPLRWAWLAAALFAVHPVHVEAVANVVGQSEVWAGLCMLVASACYIEWRRADALTTLRKAVVAGLYLVACLFKEHAVMLPVVLLAAEALVIDDDRVGERLRALRPFFMSLLLVGCVYVAFRQLIIGRDVGGFAPMIAFVSLKVGHVDRVLTMLGIVPHWVRLLAWPATLSTEYGPPKYPIAHGFALWQLPGLLILCAVLGLGLVAVRRAPVIAFGIAWMAVTLLPSSNFLLPSGILLAERTLFTPSFGAMLAITAVLPALGRYMSSSLTRILALASIGCLLWAGIARSIIRTAVWRSNDTLFIDGVRTSPDVYRSHYVYGSWMMAKNQRAIGEREYLIALSLFASDPAVAYNLGQEYFNAGQYDRAFEMFSRAERVMPQYQDVQSQLALTRAVQGSYSEAEILAKRAMEAGVGDRSVLTAIMNAAALDALSRERLERGIAAQRRGVIAR